MWMRPKTRLFNEAYTDNLWELYVEEWSELNWLKK